jgi:hypothetical protein
MENLILCATTRRIFRSPELSSYAPFRSKFCYTFHSRTQCWNFTTNGVIQGHRPPMVTTEGHSLTQCTRKLQFTLELKWINVCLRAKTRVRKNDFANLVQNIKTLEVYGSRAPRAAPVGRSYWYVLLLYSSCSYVGAPQLCAWKWPK